MTQEVRWAVVVTGEIARTIGDLRRCESADVVGVCSRRQEG
jgi:hypothetical protein